MKEEQQEESDEAAEKGDAENHSNEGQEEKEPNEQKQPDEDKPGDQLADKGQPKKPSAKEKESEPSEQQDGKPKEKANTAAKQGSGFSNIPLKPSHILFALGAKAAARPSQLGPLSIVPAAPASWKGEPTGASEDDGE